MIADQVLKRIRWSFEQVSMWGDQLPRAAQRCLSRRKARKQLAIRSYIDAYWRVCQASPLILAAIESCNVQRDLKSVKFWAHHLNEELGHDLVQYNDIVTFYGAKRRADQALARFPISPASAAIVGYFYWQVTHENPHVLMVYRLFLELFMVEQPRHAAFFTKILGSRATRSVALHSDADLEHVQHCAGYLNRHFGRDQLPILLWTVDFVCGRLIDSQVWIARDILSASSR